MKTYNNVSIFFLLFLCLSFAVKLKKHQFRKMGCQHVFIKNKATGEYLSVSDVSYNENSFLVFIKKIFFFIN